MRAVRHCLLGCLLWLIGLTAQASSVPDLTLGDTNGTVNALLINNGVLYLGGSFTSVFGTGSVQVARNNLAAINLTTGDVTAWDPDITGTVLALAVSPNGRTLYVGGNFSNAGVDPRNHLAAFDISSSTTTLLAWDPDPDGEVHALALAADGLTLYAGGSFTSFAGGSTTVVRGNLAALNSTTGAVTPWAPEPDNTVEALSLGSDAATLYVGGAFQVIGGQPRSFLGRVSLASGQADDWDPAPDNTVRALAQAGDLLYIGGDFSAVDGGAAGTRNFAAALDTTVSTAGAMATAWNPDFNGVVRALALSSGDAILYAGGDFTTANGGTTRNRLAALQTSLATGNLTAWDPGADQGVQALLTNSDHSRLYVGGAFSTIGGVAMRDGLAAFAIGVPQTTATPAGGGYTTPQTVSLACLDNAGAACTAIYFTSDGSQPQAIPADLYSAPVSVLANTTLRFFGVDAESNVETVHTEDYFIDTTAPTVSASLPGGAYGGVTLKPVTLTCDDGITGSGCAAIHYTVDDTAPDTSSVVYIAPIELDALLPSGAGQIILRFIAVDGAGNQSVEGTETYDIDVQPPVITASLPDGNYEPPQTVTLSCDDGDGTGCSAVYYTLDGTVPSDGTIEDDEGNLIPPSSLYTGPLTFNSATLLNVLAVDNADNKDTALAGVYGFTVQRGDDNTAGSLQPLTGLVLLLWLAVRRFSGGSGAWR